VFATHLLATRRTAPPPRPIARRGFHDHHVHLLAAAARRLSVDVADATVAEVRARIAAAARRTPPGGWIRAWGHDEALAPDRRAPARADLDAAAPRHPVVLHDRTGHVATLNSAALDALARRAPAAALPADGVLVDGHAALAHVPRLEPERLDAAVAALSAELAAAGVTAVTDATATNGLDELRRVAGLVRSGRLRQRVDMMVSAGALDELLDAGLRYGAIAGGIRVRHAKLVVTEATDPAQLRETVAGCVRRGWPVALHVCGIVEADAALAALEAAPPPPGARHRIEHLSLSLDEHVARLARLPVLVVTNPSFLEARAPKYERELSADERRWLYRVGSLLAAGVPVLAGSDAPVTTADPLDGARCAATRTGPERVDARAALGLFASSAARTADTVVLSEDPAAGPGTLARARVLSTMIRGERVFAAPATERARA
jgi:predicted amidohydrolase YtcJ